MIDTGTLTLYDTSYAPVSSDGPSAGAVMAVGFLVVLRDLNALSMQLNLMIKDVSRIQEAYEMMTGRKL